MAPLVYEGAALLLGRTAPHAVNLPGFEGVFQATVPDGTRSAHRNGLRYFGVTGA